MAECKGNGNMILATCEGTIQFLQAQRNEYRDKMTSIIEFLNWLTKDVPLMLRCALEDVDDKDVPPSVISFVLLCEDMMKRFKEDLKDLKGRNPEV